MPPLFRLTPDMVPILLVALVRLTLPAAVVTTDSVPTFKNPLPLLSEIAPAAVSASAFAAPVATFAPSVSEPAVVVSVVSPPDVTAPVVVSA